MLVSAHILLHVPMSSEKWGSSQMLGTTSTKTIVDYRDGTQLFAPVDKNWCERNHLVCQFCQKMCFTLSHQKSCLGHEKLFGFWDSRTEIDTIPLTHWKNLGWNWDSLGRHPPLVSGQCLLPNRTTPMLKTSPRGVPKHQSCRVEMFKAPWIQDERYEAELSLTILQQNFEIAKGWMQPVSYFLLSTEPPGLWRNVARSATYTFSVAGKPRHTTLLPDSWACGPMLVPSHQTIPNPLWCKCERRCW